MSTPMATPGMVSEKRAVALNSVYAAIVLTGGKLIVGITTGSLGIMSEAAHSALDLVAAVITFISVRLSDRPADANHPYGHGKFENFSAFIETGLLLLTCIWIVYEAVNRMFFHHKHIEPSIAAFLVMFVSIAIDLWRSRALKRVADKYESQALEADALHFSTDVWSSTVVILGLALVALGDRLDIPNLSYADPIAALGVACIVVYVTWRLARRTIDALLDAAPEGVSEQLTSEVGQVSGVIGVDRLRIRRAGNRYFADVEVALGRNVTFQRSEQVASAVTEAVQRIIPDADVVVHSMPRAAASENVFDRIRAVAARSNLGVHDVSVQDIGGFLTVEQHLELDESLSLRDAHEIVCRLEEEIRRDVPEISSILTHIESEPGTIETADETRVLDANIVRHLQSVAAQFPEVIDIHEINLRRVRGHLYMSCHCTFSDDLPLSRVHELQTELEIRFKQDAPELFRVLIHPEPATDNLR